jgi:hypothetical protein
LNGLIRIDTSDIETIATRMFRNLSANVFESDGSNELWMTSALRFFILEDVMRSRGYGELLHVEADNMVYGRLSALLPTLRQHYPLAATPLTANKAYVTASVFWVARPKHLHHFNAYLMNLVHNTHAVFDDYLGWLRKYACCKKGGVRPDHNNDGIKPFAINEMTMLANYHRLHDLTLRFLPVVPAYSGYASRKPFSNVSIFAVGGEEVGPATGLGIWDPNSWGQYIGE